MLLGGRERLVAQEALGGWLAFHRHQSGNDFSYANLANLFESPLFEYLLRLDFEAREELVYCSDGEADHDDLILRVIHRRKA